MPVRSPKRRALCSTLSLANCGVKGNNTYQIVYTGNSGIAMDGAATLARYSSDPL